MQFTQIPQQFAPLGRPVRYAVKHDAAADIDIRILARDDESVLAAKRFAAVSEAEFDVAPALRRSLRFAPETGGTGFIDPTGRSVDARVMAFVTGHEEEAVISALRAFLPGVAAPDQSGIRTTMPLERLIPEGAADELTLFAATPCAVTVTATAPDSVTAQHYQSAGNGLQPFRLDTREFAGAETITVDAGACGSILYTLVPGCEEAVRLAWRTGAGSIEHYSFPIVRETALGVDKTRAEGPDGAIVAAVESVREMRLASAFEQAAVLEALAGLIEAPQVWRVGKEGYEPVDVATDSVTIRQHGAMHCLEVTIRSTRKSSVSWS